MCSQQVHRANVHCIFLYIFGQPHRLDRQHQHILILLPSWPSSTEIHVHKDLHIYIYIFIYVEGGSLWQLGSDTQGPVASSCIPVSPGAGSWALKSPPSCCTCTHVAGLNFPAPDSCLPFMLLPLEIHRCSHTQSWLQCPWPHHWSPSAALGMWRWADGSCCGGRSSVMGLLGLPLLPVCL